MRYAPMVGRIGAQPDGAGPEAWEIHYRASVAAERGERINGREVIVLSVGDPDLDTPKPMIDAAIRALRAGDTHYTGISGRQELREAIAGRFAERVPGVWRAENVMVAAGAQNALFGASLCIAGPDDAIVAIDPMYISYSATVRVSGAALIRCSTRPEEGFRVTRAALEAAITPETRAILYSSPNNPSGVMLADAELETIAAVAIERDLWVMADEVYSQIAFDHPHRSIAGLPGMAERTVTLDGLSKSHAMTGWRMGWAIGPTELIGHFHNLAHCMLYGLPGFSQAAALAALRDGEGGGWSAASEMREIYRRRRDRFVGAISRIDELSCATPEGGMFGLVDVRATGLSSQVFAERLFEEQGVATLDARAFGPAADGFVRVSFVVEDAVIDDACARIAAFVARL